MVQECCWHLTPSCQGSDVLTPPRSVTSDNVDQITQECYFFSDKNIKENREQMYYLSTPQCLTQLAGLQDGDLMISGKIF